MNKFLPQLALALCAVCAGCFDNRGRPPDATPVTSLKALAATNRADVTRLYLRGGTEPLKKGALADLPNLRELDLSERNLTAVPEEVFAMKSLEHLYLVRNEFKELPDALATLPALTYLNLDGNKLTGVPESLGGAVKLKWLRLNENQIVSLPDSLGKLGDLRRFYARRNRLKEVPAFLKSCTRLEDLALDGNFIAEVPDWLVKLPALKSVSFSGCRITKLPDDLSGWRRLDSLILSGCQIPAEEMARIRKELGDVGSIEQVNGKGVAVVF